MYEKVTIIGSTSGGKELVMEQSRQSAALISLNELVEFAKINMIDWTRLNSNKLSKKIVFYINNTQINTNSYFIRSDTDGCVRSYLVDSFFALNCVIYIGSYSQIFVDYQKGYGCISKSTTFSLPDNKYIHMDSIVGLVYYIIINDPQLKLWTDETAQLLIDGLIINIDNCVEDCGKIICSTGKLQRILLTLQEYLPFIHINMYHFNSESITQLCRLVETCLTHNIQNLPHDHPIKTIVTNLSVAKKLKADCIRYYKNMIEKWSISIIKDILMLITRANI
jgi:hypothetical protein